MPDPEALERSATELLQQLIRFDTVNPPGNEQALQNFLQDKLEAAGFDCTQLAAVDGRPNLVARLPERSDGPRLCYLGHADTVLANPEDWTVDPWSGELRDGCVWGRGALDMKDQVACEIAAAIALTEEGWRPESGELMIVVTADEEAGATVGAKWLCEQHRDVVRCDYVVNEGGGQLLNANGKRLYGVCVAEKGVFRFTLTAHGRAGHASIPRVGDNALVKLAPLIVALGAAGHGELSLEPEAAATIAGLGIDADGDAQQALAQLESVDPRLAVMLEPLMGVTFSPTMIRASEKVNVIPGRASLKVDCRVPPGLGQDAVRQALAGILENGDWSLEFDEQVMGNRSPAESPLMDFIGAFIEREDPGAVVAPSGLQGFTDSRWFRDAFPGCIAYGFMPAREFDLFEAAPLVHSADERVPVADLGMAARFFAELAPAILGS
ncbi:MAG TPA: M20/M25/M40 family metallo-hydrolase [Thermoleophilaceae bacterium]|nr:M20/M25/M40 family metallo-hydrolase [Thermoleophilaceae bacterium]